MNPQEQQQNAREIIAALRPGEVAPVLHPDPLPANATPAAAQQYDDTLQQHLAWLMSRPSGSLSRNEQDTLLSATMKALRDSGHR